MGRKGKNISIEVRKLIIYHYTKNCTYKEIGQILNLKQSTVGNIVKMFRNEGRIEVKKQKGQPKKLKTREKAAIIKKIQVNPRLSAPKIAAELKTKLGTNVSLSTIRRTIYENCYHGRVAKKTNSKNRKTRVEFAKKYIMKDEAWWEDAIFADESKYNVFGSDGLIRVW